MPDLYLFSKNATNYIYKESTLSPYSRVEIKIVKKLPYLPVKFGVLAAGQKNLRVELVDTKKEFAVSMPVGDNGVALFETLPNSEYSLLVGPEVSLLPAEILSIESMGGSVFGENPLLPLSIKTVNINSDVFIAPVVIE